MDDRDLGGTGLNNGTDRRVGDDTTVDKAHALPFDGSEQPRDRAGSVDACEDGVVSVGKSDPLTGLKPSSVYQKLVRAVEQRRLINVVCDELSEWPAVVKATLAEDPEGHKKRRFLVHVGSAKGTPYVRSVEMAPADYCGSVESADARTRDQFNGPVRFFVVLDDGGSSPGFVSPVSTTAAENQRMHSDIVD